MNGLFSGSKCLEDREPVPLLHSLSIGHICWPLATISVPQLWLLPTLCHQPSRGPTGQFPMSLGRLEASGRWGDLGWGSGFSCFFLSLFTSFISTVCSHTSFTSVLSKGAWLDVVQCQVLKGRKWCRSEPCFLKCCPSGKHHSGSL